MEGKNYTRLPAGEQGHFYTENCYIFLCTYWMFISDFNDGKPFSFNMKFVRAGFQFDVVVQFLPPIPSKTSISVVFTPSLLPSDLLEQYVILQKKQSTGKKRTEEGGNGDGEGGSEDEEEEEEEEEALVCRVYFWQGRDASKVCWPQYSLR